MGESDNRSLIQWFAVQVQPKHECMTALLLQYKGYETYVPTYTPESERRRQRVASRKRLVFPGYVFCRFCWEDGSSVQSGGGVVTTTGVVRIVGAGRTPIAIPDEEIDSIQRVLGSGLAAAPVPYLRIGQKVTIDTGPLRGVTGIVESMTENRLVVSIKLLQRSLAVFIERNWLNSTSLISEALALSKATGSAERA